MVTVETYTENQEIHQKMFVESFNEQRTLLSYKIMSLEEEGIKKALIELGWTPPKEEAKDHKGQTYMFKDKE